MTNKTTSMTDSNQQPQTATILSQLKAPFPPQDHKERKLRGGGKWLYIPWQKIRDRLDEVYPKWQCSYSDPLVCEQDVVIRCKITIQGVTREGVGTAPQAEFNDEGKRKGIGSPCECAIADALKNAAEQFGVGAYLDDQDFVAGYLARHGDHRATKWRNEQMRWEGNRQKVIG